MRLLVIAAGGATGALTRYFVTGWVQSWTASAFPIGTLVVIATFLLGPSTLPDPYRAFLLVGFLGAYTTFSTFSWDTLSLFDDGRPELALLNVVASNLLCLGGVWLGHRLASA